MTYNQCWEYLMWLDPVGDINFCRFLKIQVVGFSKFLKIVSTSLQANHGGVRGKLPDGLGDAGEGNENSLRTSGVPFDETDSGGPEIVMNWNLSEFLPEEANVQGHFTTIIATYISTIYQFMAESEPVLGTPMRRQTTASQATQTAPTGVGAHLSTAEFAKNLITGELSQKLFT
ncbi:unnamed protein product, partial [Nesidiocoris tenuis]